MEGESLIIFGTAQSFQPVSPKGSHGTCHLIQLEWILPVIPNALFVLGPGIYLPPFLPFLLFGLPA